MSKLREWLAERDIGPMKFAPIVGVSHVQIYRILKGRRRPSWKLAKRIEAATAGAVTPDDLLGTPKQAA